MATYINSLLQFFPQVFTTRIDHKVAYIVRKTIYKERESLHWLKFIKNCTKSSLISLLNAWHIFIQQGLQPKISYRNSLLIDLWGTGVSITHMHIYNQ